MKRLLIGESFFAESKRSDLRVHVCKGIYCHCYSCHVKQLIGLGSTWFTYMPANVDQWLPIHQEYGVKSTDAFVSTLVFESCSVTRKVLREAQHQISLLVLENKQLSGVREQAVLPAWTGNTLDANLLEFRNVQVGCPAACALNNWPMHSMVFKC